MIGIGLVSLNSMLTALASTEAESVGQSKVIGLILLACGLIAMGVGFLGMWRVRQAHAESTSVGSAEPSSKPVLDWRKDERISGETRRCESAWLALIFVNFASVLGRVTGLLHITMGWIVGFAVAQVILVALVLLFRAQRRKAYEALG
jgi:dipeptide/tripeptide permease